MGATTTTWVKPEQAPTLRNGLMVILLSVVSCGLYFTYWLYLLHNETPRREQTDPSGGRAFGVFLGVALLSGALLLASGAPPYGDEINVPVFGVGMAVRLVAYFLMLRIAWRLNERLGIVGAPYGRAADDMDLGRVGIVIAIVCTATSGIAMKSVESLVPGQASWVSLVRLILLGLSVLGLFGFGRSCLAVANAYGTDQNIAHGVLSIEE